MHHALSDHATDDYNPDEPGAAYFAMSADSRRRLGYNPDDEEDVIDRQLFRQQIGYFRQRLAGRSYQELMA